MIYKEIHMLRGEGFSNSPIARKLKISRNRVVEYGITSPEEFYFFSMSLQNRSKKLDPFREEILGWLKEHPDLSGAQVLDWLGEKLDVSSVTEGTVRNYVNEIREVYHIPKMNSERNYSTVPDLPIGQQIQVDFGQIRWVNRSKRAAVIFSSPKIEVHSVNSRFVVTMTLARS